jgi:hypothetical protein
MMPEELPVIIRLGLETEPRATIFTVAVREEKVGLLVVAMDWGSVKVTAPD